MSHASLVKPGVNSAAAPPFSFSNPFLAEGTFGQFSGIRGKTKKEFPDQVRRVVWSVDLEGGGKRLQRSQIFQTDP